MFNDYIIKGIGGFYYVKTADGIIECKAKGIFRKEKITPVAGDYVKLEIEEHSNVISEILPRKNVFVRPPIANVDNFFIIVSTVQPVPSTLIIDKLCAIAVDKGAKPYIIVTKADLASEQEIYHNYETSDIEVFNSKKQEDILTIKKLLKDNINVFCGNSGVGKSTLLAELLPNISFETGEISKKLGRGRHTTREVELFEAFGGLVADTPGFASLEMDKAAAIVKENVEHAFPDIMRYYGECKFTGCSHMSEKGCAVLMAVDQNKISKSRYNSYRMMFEEASAKKDWER